MTSATIAGAPIAPEPGAIMTTTKTLSIGDTNPVDVTVTESGEGHPILLLHGGGGPQTVAGFAELLASGEHAHVVTPTHPGWGGTKRPEALSDIRSLAALYGQLLDQLDLTDVTVVGNSIGGWIAAEMALLHSPRISSVILVGATGLEVPGHPVVDFFSLTMDQVADLSYHNPDGFRIDLTALPPAAQAVVAGNRAALAVFGGATMVDSSLAERLPDITVPILVISGESDRIVDPDVGRAYADAIPGAEFRLMSETGHMPQLETPERLLREVWAFADAHAANPTVR
jgi:pimeloyl-ACP methyl ester carboxylesterase